MDTGLLTRSPNAGGRRLSLAPAPPANQRGGIARRFRTAMLSGISTATLCFTFFVLASAGGDAQPTTNDYRLDSMDQVRLKVFEWRPSRDEIYEWKALNDEYVIGSGGRLSLPMIGEVAASGLTPSELARAIGERMQTQIGLVDVPNISVEVVKFRPFYITGRVANPGEYAFRPHLTVLQALSVAGGIYRADRQPGLRLEREAISGQGDLDLLSLDRNALVARRARIEADLHDETEIPFPEEISANVESNRQLMIEEQSILRSRREAYKAQLDPLVQLKTHLNSEVESLAKQLDVHNAQAGLANEELQIVKSLAEKKLAVETRRIAAQRNVYQLDADHMGLQMNLVRVRQEVTKTDLSISELRSKRANDMTEELRSTQAKLDEVSRKYATTKKLLLDTALSDGQELGEGEMGQLTTNTFTIVRSAGGQSTEIAADESTPVQPGDTIKVKGNSAGSAPLARRRPEPDDEERFAPAKKNSREPDRYQLEPTYNGAGSTARKI